LTPPPPAAPVAAVEASSSARTKAATLPPPPPRTSVPPLLGAVLVRPSTTVPPMEPPAGLPSLPPGATAKPRAEIVDTVDDDPSVTDPTMQRATTDQDSPFAPRGSDLDTTNPRLVMPLPAPPASSPELKLPGAPWAAGLAARIDRALDHDDFGGETQEIAPTAAELRALLGAPDTTRKQSLDELERLHAAATHRDHRDSELDLPIEPPPPRRAQHSTAEVSDADIEAAIELVPPARRTAIGVAKKKPEE
jgi:hypothetical protein